MIKIDIDHLKTKKARRKESKKKYSDKIKKEGKAKYDKYVEDAGGVCEITGKNGRFNFHHYLKKGKVAGIAEMCRSPKYSDKNIDDEIKKTTLLIHTSHNAVHAILRMLNGKTDLTYYKAVSGLKDLYNELLKTCKKGKN